MTWRGCSATRLSGVADGQVQLTGVPETMLWTLYYRATEARRPDAVIRDPKAMDLVDAIDYPFEERFGRAVDSQAQWQGLRARRFDTEVRRFLRDHPGGTVVALGEGLETQFWRVDDGEARWLTVDLPESVDVRTRLLPPESDRQRVFAGSATDDAWMDEVDPSAGVLITAQGLLMYLQPEEARGLIARCARRFGGGGMVFDAAPRWLSTASQRGKVKTPGYQAPPWYWGWDPDEGRRVRDLPGVESLRELRLGRGRDGIGAVLSLVSATPVLRGIGLTIVRAEFAG
jgi:O-methyltransferase involved in polyketide biosynthesis